MFKRLHEEEPNILPNPIAHNIAVGGVVIKD